MKKVLVSVASARPNFVKLAAIHHAWAERHTEHFEHFIIHTGQHYDPLFSDVFFEQLRIPQPLINLGIAGVDRDEMIVNIKNAMEGALEQVKPDCVLVYGDVNGTVGAAQAAERKHIPVAHVEAGLRSFDNTMPEELNRILVDRMARWLFCTEESGVRHLRTEGVLGEIHMAGNTMIDTLLRMKPLIDAESAQVPVEGPFGVVTLHRPSNVDTKVALSRNIDFLNEVAALSPLVLPAHHRLRAHLKEFDLESSFSSNVHLVDPLGYIPFMRVVQSSAFILTDSGGIQEEAVLFGKRCFTLRKNTERPVTIECGSNILIDIDIQEDQQKVLDFAMAPKDPVVTIPSMWDGQAGEHILTSLAASLS